MNQVQRHIFINQDQPHTVFLFSGISILVVLAILFAVGWLVLGTAYIRYMGLTRGKSALLWLLSFVTAIISLIVRAKGDPEDEAIFVLIISTILFSMLSVPFVVRLYRKWIGGHLTEAEKLPGMDGVRAWLGKGNVICAVLIPICAWQVFDLSLLTMFVLTFGSLLAYPVFNLAFASPQPAAVVATEDLSNEREKVLQLLETGKITAEESAELLNSLGQSVPFRPPLVSEREISAQRKIVLLGAALILLGFFLPWFSINPGAMANDMAAQLRQNMNQIMPGNPMPQMPVPLPITIVQVHAGDLAHGLGWWILALGVGVAALPFFATTLNAQMQKKVMLAALAMGAFLLIYLLSGALRNVSIGIVLALAGYGLEFLGTLKERPAAY